MLWISCHGTADSDIFQSGPYELVRTTMGFGWDKVVIIYNGVKVRELGPVYEGLAKARAWCDEHAALTPEIDFAQYADMSR